MDSPVAAGRPRLVATVSALIALAAAVALMLVPVRGFSVSAASALLAHPKPLPGGTAPKQDPAEVAADQAAVDHARTVLDDIRAEGARVSDAQRVASDTSDRATKARTDATSTDDYTLQMDVSSAQTDVDMAQSNVDFDNDSISSAKSSLDSDRENGWDTTYDQQALDDATSKLAADQDKLTAAKNALSAAQSKLDGATTDQQNAQRRADALSSSAADLQKHADDLAAQQQSRESDANDALTAAEATQSRHRSDAAVALARWTHDHRLAVDAVRAQNSVAADARRAAEWVAGSATGLVLIAIGFVIAAVVLGRRNRPAAEENEENAMDEPSGVGALLGMFRDRLPTPRRRLRRS